jgi:hypothetical protein
MTIKWKRVENAFLSLLSNRGTEFSKKYIENIYNIHSIEEITQFRLSLDGLLRTKLDEKRTLYALNVHRFLLTENDMDDWRIFIEYLSGKEIASNFWKRYRDHTAHQVLCFLLGAYIYENCTWLQECFREEFKSGLAHDSNPLRSGFYYQWSTATLLHDFGYYFDIEKGVSDPTSEQRIKTIQEFFSHIDRYLKDYIYIVYKLGQKTENLSPDIERFLGVFQALLGHSQPEHHYQSSKDFTELGRFFGSSEIAKDYEDAWDLLDRFAASRNSRFSGVFQNYFRILATFGAPYGEQLTPVWDHGIASGILFLKLSVFCWSYFQAFSNIAKEADAFEKVAGNVAKEIRSSIAAWDYTEGAFWGALLPACFAMAVHNLRDFSASDLEHYGYTKDDRELLRRVGNEVLPIKIEDGVVPYLLTIVDQLQDWDRYPIVRTGDMTVLKLLESEDIRLSTEGHRVFIRFSTTARNRKEELCADLDKLAAEWQKVIEVM